ncbi:MAG: S9 family peptidase [Chloroflexota bacterium]|nr:S9 family peptidase [Chloroflexota bacterium]
MDRERLGALGVSLGGAVTVLAAARDPRLKAVVDDCGFGDVASATATAYEHFIGLPAFPFAPISVRISEWRTGQRVSAARPIDVVGRLGPRPLLIIHGLADRQVPPTTERASSPPRRSRRSCGWWRARATASASGRSPARSTSGASWGSSGCTLASRAAACPCRRGTRLVFRPW